MPDNNTTREFSYSLPITYKGVSYPSAPANILTDGSNTYNRESKEVSQKLPINSNSYWYSRNQ